MSSYQVVRNFWNFVGTTDLENEPISIADCTKEVLENFKRHFKIIFVDKSGCYNLAAFLNIGVYRKVKAECLQAVKHLDDNKNSSFQQLFLTKYPFYLQYDLVIDLNRALPLEDKYSIEDEERAKFIGYKDLLIVNYIMKTIQRALNKRILSLVPRVEVDSEDCSLKKLFFGINLNPDEAFNFLEIGPALNDHVAAAEFRQFWGHLSSDRRFRDGSTNVAVHFKTNTIKGKRGIIRKILSFIIEEKLNLKFKFHYDEFEEILVSKRLVPSYPCGTNEETTLKIIQASDELGKKLRAMQMSLKITGVQGASDIFCYAHVFPPVPANYEVIPDKTIILGKNIMFLDKKLETVPRYILPVDCVLQLEHSSKWPSDLEALRHIKTSFYLEISKMLESEHENGLTCYRDSLDSFHLDNSLNVMPKIIGALKGLQSLYPSFGPGCALIKRWLRSQLIDEYYFPDIVVDLLNASLYLDNPFVQSNTPQMSFLRFLKFFSEFDWNLQTVIVNFSG
ncbi:hypothetical protein NQ318_017856 [Aromia moschata]|uniref:Nucleolar protein 6 n=1 Tax=Aromia moschata TaxID=1265417 RepID=A0AAV8XQP9_9CUCU|nr:hypothetical protein NQ318_017856 [Aromia moschata]